MDECFEEATDQLDEFRETIFIYWEKLKFKLEKVTRQQEMFVLMKDRLKYFVDPEDWQIFIDGEGNQRYLNVRTNQVQDQPPVRKAIPRMQKLKKLADVHRSQLAGVAAFGSAGKHAAIRDASGSETEQERRVGLASKEKLSVSAKMKAEKREKQSKRANSRADMRGGNDKSGSGTDEGGFPSSPGAGDPGIRDKVL